MPSSVALLVFAGFIFWLFAKDLKRSGNNSSRALWIPVLWAFIIGSRPVSMWLGMPGAEGSDGYAQDTLIDKALYLLLIASGWMVLIRRRTNWRAVFAANKWLVVFFIYLGLSALWADDPLVAFKRWIKDVGNVIMVLVIVGEEDPIEGIRSFLARCAYLLVPLSVLMIKYFPGKSRVYDQWTFMAHYVGVNTNKNMFGMTLFMCAVGLGWMLLKMHDEEGGWKHKATAIRYGLLILMTGWLLRMAGSSTALVCTLIGGMILFGLRFPAIRGRIGRLELYSVIALVTILFLQVSGLGQVLTAEFARLVGRDPSFHGRTAIWTALLKQDINPLLGAGYYSFWSPERAQKLSEQYYYTLNEAHNGYLETYLNSGVIGLFLLLAVLLAAVERIKRAVVAGDQYARLCLAFLATAVFYAISESIFNRLSLMWFAVLLAVIEFPRRVEVGCESEQEPARAGIEPGPENADAVAGSAV